MFSCPAVENYETKCLATIEQGLETNPDNEGLKQLKTEFKREYDLDHKIDVNPEEKKTWDNFFEWMQKGGAKYDRLKVRSYGPDYRGVHA